MTTLFLDQETYFKLCRSDTHHIYTMTKFTAHAMVFFMLLLCFVYVIVPVHGITQYDSTVYKYIGIVFLYLYYYA